VGGSDAAHVYVVGSDGITLRRGPYGWYPMTTATHVDLNAVWVQAPGQAFAVGGNGVILNGHR
jgi:hypothetical protein